MIITIKVLNTNARQRMNINNTSTYIEVINAIMCINTSNALEKQYFLCNYYYCNCNNNSFNKSTKIPD